MSFVTTLALLVGLLAVGPFIAHRLRRKKLEVKPFPAVRLVPAGAAQAQRRSKLEDRALFAVRVLLILLLALLGAGPLRNGSKLALARLHGSEVGLVIVLDDSLSMSAIQKGGDTRFSHAVASASEVVRGLSPGDSVALVLAGSPARVRVPSTTAPREVLAFLETAKPTFRATDLDTALTLADRIAESMAQKDRRLVLLSDLADGHPEATPLGADLHTPLWFPLPELAGAGADCGVITAVRERDQVRAHIVCSSSTSPTSDRTISLLAADGTTVSQAPLPSARGGDITLQVAGAGADSALRVRLSPGDTILEDDMLDVRSSQVALTIGFIGNHIDAPGIPSEHALTSAGFSALESEATLRPLASFPDTALELSGYSAIIHDNPRGYTPEQRRALDDYLRNGASLLLSLGPDAEAATLGQSFEPFLHDPIGWSRTPASPPSSDVAAPPFASVVSGLADLRQKGRATLSTEDARGFERQLGWGDGTLLFAKRRVGKGELWISSLPFSSETSDLPFRPGFLTLLDAFLDDVRRLAPVQVVTAGATWSVPGTDAVAVRVPGGATRRVEAGTDRTIELDQAGVYSARVEGRDEARVVKLPPSELELRPRALAKSGELSRGGGDEAKVAESRTIAFLLLAAVCAELVARALSVRKSRGEPAL